MNSTFAAAFGLKHPSDDQWVSYLRTLAMETDWKVFVSQVKQVQNLPEKYRNRDKLMQIWREENHSM